MNPADRAREQFPRGLTRRAALAALAAAASAVAAPPLALAAAAPVLGVQEPVADGLRRVVGSRPRRDGTGVVKVELPAIAENGAVVPLGVEVVSPMTAARHVKAIWVVADRNRVPIALRAELGPEAGRAMLGVNLRLADSGPVRVIVEQSDGTLLEVVRDVRVTVSGCAA